MRRPRIQVLLDDAILTRAIRTALRALKAEVAVSRLDDLQPPDFPPADARLVLTRNFRRLSNGRLQLLLNWCRLDPCATLVIGDGAGLIEGEREPLVASIPIEFTGGLSAENLVGRLSAMCAWSRSLGVLQKELDDVRGLEHRHAALVRELGVQLREAASLQRELAKANTVIRSAELHVFHQAASMVGGDFHDVVRLDARHVAITVADACGHDLAAGLLAAYLQRGLREATRSSAIGSTPSPDGVLRQLNADVLSVDLSDCRFATLVFAIFDEQERRLRWARAGAPEPLLVRPGTSPSPLISRGPLLGVCAEPDFEVKEIVLGDGDTVLFYTDGLYTMFDESANRATPSVADLPWCRNLPIIPVAEAFVQLNLLLPRPAAKAPAAARDVPTEASTFDPNPPSRDDVTAVALHIPFPTRPSPVKVPEIDPAAPV